MTHIGEPTRSSSPQVTTAVRPLATPAADATPSLRPRRRQVRFGARDLQTHSPVFGRAVEVSASGLRLESYAALVVGGRYRFRFGYAARFIHLDGRVVWCSIDRFEPTPQGCRTIYRAGIALDSAQADPGWRAALADRAGVALGA